MMCFIKSLKNSKITIDIYNINFEFITKLEGYKYRRRRKMCDFKFLANR